MSAQRGGHRRRALLQCSPEQQSNLRSRQHRLKRRAANLFPKELVMSSCTRPLTLAACLVALAVGTCPRHAQPTALGAPAEPGSTPDSPVAVSLLQLIATPDVFEGKYVRVWGFVRI